jgi:coronin-1B/1C/6
MKVDDFTKFQINDPMLKGHTGAITDFEFNPFIDNVLATASEDGTAALWTIPIDGLTEDLKIPNATLYGHSKKLTHLRFNPSAENVLATASFDLDVKIWDAYHAKEVSTTSGVIGQPTCLEWNYDGSLLAAMDKKKILHVVDPRDQAGAMKTDKAHDGPKQLKCCWLDSSNRILTTGMSKSMFKEIAIWDLRDLTSPVINKKSDKNIEVSDPFYDPFNKLVY